MSSFNVVLDACVLFPAPLRDTLLRAAQAGLYRMYFTDDILEEVRRNLVNKRNITEDKAQKLVSAMREQFPESFVTGYSRLVASMENNVKDRHVLAAAVRCNAQVIVTMNLKDFPPESLAPFDIEAQSPDAFLLHLFHLAPDAMAQLIIEQAGDLHNPSMTAPELLANHLQLHAPEFVKLVQGILKVEESIYSWVKTNKFRNQ